MNYNEYHPHWKDVIRPAILKRDNYSCVVCGIKHGITVYKTTSGRYIECDSVLEEWAKKQGYKVFKLILQVAHLDHNKANNDPKNLRTLCPIHHARYDKDHKRLLRIATMAKPIVKPNFDKVIPTEQTKNLLSDLRKFFKSEFQFSLTLDECEDVVNQVSLLIKKHLK